MTIPDQLMWETGEKDIIGNTSSLVDRILAPEVETQDDYDNREREIEDAGFAFGADMIVLHGAGGVYHAYRASQEVMKPATWSHLRFLKGVSLATVEARKEKQRMGTSLEVVK